MSPTGGARAYAVHNLSYTHAMRGYIVLSITLLVLIFPPHTRFASDDALAQQRVDAVSFCTLSLYYIVVFGVVHAHSLSSSRHLKVKHSQALLGIATHLIGYRVCVVHLVPASVEIQIPRLARRRIGQRREYSPVPAADRNVNITISRAKSG